MDSQISKPKFVPKSDSTTVVDGSTVITLCKPGYTPIGPNNKVVCNGNVWEGELANCEPASKFSNENVT